MKRLLSYLKVKRGCAILAPLLKMLEASFELIIPLIIADIIDKGIANENITYTVRMGLLMIMLGVVGFCVSVTAQKFSAITAVYTGTALRSDLYRHINSLSYKELDETGTSTLITRMTSDINQVQTGVNMFLRLFLRSPFIVFGAMIMAFTVDVKAAVPFVITVPLLFLIVLGIVFITMPMYRKVQKRLDLIMQNARENLQGIRVVRAFHREESEIRDFRKSSGSLYHDQIKVGMISAFLNPVTYVIINLGIIGILMIGSRQVNSGLLLQGQVIALVNYMSQILVELIKLSNLIITLSRAMACMNRVDDVFKIKNSMADGTEAFPKQVVSCTGMKSASGKKPSSYKTGSAEIAENTDIRGASVDFDSVTFSYNTGEPSLKNISFHADAGETIGIIGSTGAGKTTLVNLISRFYDPGAGNVTVNGKDLRQIRRSELGKHIGIVPQKAVLFTGTIRSNMLWGNENASTQDIREALRIAQAEEFVDQLSDGIDASVEQGGNNFSGGQRQRLTIARTLLRRPDILILDDSSSALDYVTDARLRTSLRKSCRGTTVFLVSQRVSTIRGADRILVLENGNLAGIGTHRELIRKCKTYREICASQMSEQEFAKEAAS